MIQAIAFDFDGVLVETVDVKAQAFARLFAQESPQAVQDIVAYHLRNGGISRFVKFKTIYREILRRPLSDSQAQGLGTAFSRLVLEDVIGAPWVDGAREFLAAHRGRYRFMVVSGTPQEELHTIVRRRGMAEVFAAVMGSPPGKDLLLRRLMHEHRLAPDALVFVGDAQGDWEAARQGGVRFVWRCAEEGSERPAGFTGPVIRTLAELSDCLRSLERGRVAVRSP